MKRLIFFCILFFQLACSIQGYTQADSVASKKETGAPVIYKKDTLFYVYANLGSFKPAERAAIIERRISTLSFETTFVSDSLKIVEDKGATNIVYDDIIIVTVMDGDAEGMGLSRNQAARKIHEKLQQSLEGALTFNVIKTVLVRVGLTILEILILYFLLKYVNKLFVFTRKWLVKSKDKYFKGFKLRDYEFLDSNRQLSLAVFANNILRWV